MRLTTIIICIVVVGVASQKKDNEPTSCPETEKALDSGLRNLMTILCLRCTDLRRQFVISPEHDFLCIRAPRHGYYTQLDFVLFSGCSKTACKELLTKRFTGLIPITQCYASDAPTLGVNYNRFGHRRNWYYLNPKLELDYSE